jgi:uncharacterized membrane protein (Fun14 family)
MSFSTTVNGIFDAIKTNWQKVDLKKWSQDIGGSSAEAVHAALYFVLAFGVGFTLKKYFRYLVSGLFLAIILIKLLEYNGILSINWSQLRALTGVGSAADLNTVANAFIAWVKNNIFLFGASVIGILLGYRLG